MYALCTWNIFNVIGIVVFLNGGAVYHNVRRMTLHVDSSHKSECIATAKAAEVTVWGRHIMQAIGLPEPGPTPIYSDNLANVLISKGQGSPKNCKHFLRRYVVIKQRQRDGEIDVRKIADKDNPSDFLTKWVEGNKLDKSVRRLANLRNRVGTPPGKCDKCMLLGSDLTRAGITCADCAKKP